MIACQRSIFSCPIAPQVQNQLHIYMIYVEIAKIMMLIHRQEAGKESNPRFGVIIRHSFIARQDNTVLFYFNTISLWSPSIGGKYGAIQIKVMGCVVTAARTWPRNVNEPEAIDPIRNLEGHLLNHTYLKKAFRSKGLRSTSHMWGDELIGCHRRVPLRVGIPMVPWAS